MNSVFKTFVYFMASLICTTCGTDLLFATDTPDVPALTRPAEPGPYGPASLAPLGLYSSTMELALATSSPTGSEPSLQDLGFSSDQTEGNAQDQATLDRRSHMLKIHQRWGLATTVPMIATLFLAPGDKSSASQRTLHGGVGLLTFGMYSTTAFYAIRAPKIPGTKEKGPIRLHKALAFVHLPGMILTPILGAMADEQRNAGEKVHGIASAHGAVASITIAAYLASILAVSIKF